MAVCNRCLDNSKLVSEAIGYCVDCIRDAARSEELVDARVSHRKKARSNTIDGSTMIPCLGFTDRHPANCIASWLCPGTTGCGYPRYAVKRGCEEGYTNIGVFLGGCNFNCAFCQDWIHKIMLERNLPAFSLEEILLWPNEKTTCLCFCGGNPDLHMREIIWLSKRFREKRPDGILRICAETNLTGDSELVCEFAKLAVCSGGGLNIGLKAGSEAVHVALTGSSNKKIFENIKMLHETFGVEHAVPLLRPSLLLVPGYVDDLEIEIVCKTIADLDPCIPLKFIPFLPRRQMTDLPRTSNKDLIRALEIAESVGLRRISPNEEDIYTQRRFVRARERQSLTSGS